LPSSAVRLILLPRYTALHGAMTVYTPPLSVKDFASAIFTAWKSTGLGATPADVSFQIQQSTDLGIWVDLGSSFTPASAGAEIAVEREFTLEWIRLKAVVGTGATNPGITAWVVGAFVPRERAGE
jgi:hypothetical protein